MPKKIGWVDDQAAAPLIKKLESLNSNQFGYNAFGLKESIKRKPKHYFTAYKQRYF